METRETKRLRARQFRAAFAKSNAEKFKRTEIAVREVLDRFWSVLADAGFIVLLRQRGLATIPARSPPQAGDSNFGHYSLDFVVAWTFLHPMLADPQIAAYLEDNWPNFIAEMKDAFILLVSNGPFPPECRTVGRPVRSPFPSERTRRNKSSAK